MHVLFASSEVAPFARTGGMSDVCGALPRALADMGHVVTVVTPAYREIESAGLPIEPTGVELDIPIGGKILRTRLLRGSLPGGLVDVIFVDHPDYFHRPSLYGVDGDYPDNCARFTLFCRAVLEAIRTLELSVDVVHCHDWQTGLIPAYLNVEYAKTPGYESIASLMTIHNLAYQGSFWHLDMLLTGLDWKYFNWKQMEFFGKLNLLKTGIVFADRINTVSDQYSREIQSDEFGCGLDGVLRHRQHRLSGILNGIDDREWNPASDPHIERNYSVADWSAGKAVCKAALQRQLGLPVDPQATLIGQIGRLTEQKGWDLTVRVAEQWQHEGHIQWAFLGRGEEDYHGKLAELARKFPAQVASRLEFSDVLAHRIQAAADILLMPSRFEPCGLNQMCGLRLRHVAGRSGGWRSQGHRRRREPRERRRGQGERLYPSIVRTQSLWSRRCDVHATRRGRNRKCGGGWSNSECSRIGPGGRAPRRYADLYSQLRPDVASRT